MAEEHKISGKLSSEPNGVTCISSTETKEELEASLEIVAQREASMSSSDGEMELKKAFSGIKPEESGSDENAQAVQANSNAENDTELSDVFSTLGSASVPIPCPANGDSVIFTNDVYGYVLTSSKKCQTAGGEDGRQFAVLEDSNDALIFVVYHETCEQPAILQLDSMMPGFDSIFVWQASNKVSDRWLVCTHLPVSGAKRVSDSCRKFIFPVTYQSRLADTIIQAYDLTHVTTVRSWRESQAYVSPTAVFSIIQRIAHSLNEIFEHRHALIRISQDTVVIQEDGVKFLGVVALDQPWNERCALAHHQVEYAAIPPECFGFMQKRITLHQGVYVLGALAYYLVAGAPVPTCEALGYDLAIEARAFNPEFPVGWDEIIHRALMPNPEKRFSCIDEFVEALNQGLDLMYCRRDYTGALSYDIAVDTHIGITKRLRCPINQDAVFTRSSPDGHRILMVVADGVSTSTYGSGDIASGIVVSEAEKAWKDRIFCSEHINATEEIEQIFERANQNICDYILERYADEHPTSSECMGTTALVAIIENGVLTLGSIGDSRAYVIRKKSMECITRDHNLFTIGIINGLPVETCAMHPHTGSLVQCLGYYDESSEQSGLAYDIFSMHLIPGDTLMLTTDGILDYVDCNISDSEQKIAEIVRNASGSAIGCLQLIMQANIGGGGDNCGVGLVRVT